MIIRTKTRKIWHIGLPVLVFLLAVGFMGGCGSRFLFSSPKDMASTPDALGLHYEKVWFSSRDGMKLHAWLVSGHPDKPMVLFFHGNSANISYGVGILKYLNGMGFSVFTFDYRGFGESQGRTVTEEDLYQDARGALDYLRIKGWLSSRMIYFGQSMGAAVSLQLALEAAPAAVVLECPFTSMSDIASHTAPITYALIGWWAIDVKFDNLNKIPKISAPLVIFQGDKDPVVPKEMAQRLFQRANQPKALYLISGGRHTDLYKVGGDKYRRAWLNLAPK